MAGKWTTTRLRQVAAINPDAIGRDWPYSYIRYIDISSVGVGQIEAPPQWTKVSDAPSRAKRLVRKGDIVLSTVRPNRRSMFFAAQPGDDWVVSTGFAVLRPNTKLIDPRFLYAYVFNQAFTEYLITREKGAAYPAVSPDDIVEAEIALPPLPEQRAIAHIIGALDDKIELNRRMNETLEAIARALFKSWFVDFDPVRAKAEGRDPGLPKPLADLFPDFFEDSDLGEIPKGWRVGTLGNVAEHPRRGVQPDEVDASTPYIALEHMPRRCIALSEWGIADGLESNKFKFKRGEILFGKLRPYFHKVGVAPVDGICSTDIVVVTPREEKWFGFVLGHVSSVAFVDHTNAGSTGTKMPRTSWGEMARYSVVLPTDPIAKAFSDNIRPIVARIVASIHQSRSLATLRDTLLPRLVSGDVRVSPAFRTKIEMVYSRKEAVNG